MIRTIHTIYIIEKYLDNLYVTNFVLSICNVLRSVVLRDSANRPQQTIAKSSNYDFALNYNYLLAGLDVDCYTMDNFEFYETSAAAYEEPELTREEQVNTSLSLRLYRAA